MHSRSSALAALIVLGVVLGAPAGAWAAKAEITSPPVIRGTAQVGQTLTVSATWTGKPEPTATWQWLRCSRAGDNCAPIVGAKSDRYSAVAADAGAVLRVDLTVTNPP